MKTDVKGAISGLQVDYQTSKQYLTICLDEDFRSRFDEWKDKPLLVTIAKYFKKRSLDANALFWATVGDLSSVLGIPSTEIYKSYVKEIGDNYVDYPVPDNDVEAHISAWGHGRLGWVADVIGKCKKPGYTYVRFYKGSSVYDSAQMHRLIDMALFDAKEQGIPPRLTKKELEMTIERWGKDATM